MRYQQSLFEVSRQGLILLVTLALSSVSIAGTYELELLFAQVPGADEYESGDLDAAIELLESTDKTADDRFYVANELATLCAFYILKDNLGAARETCSAAVETDRSDFAYNNRGVLRARLGDAVGALQDFDRVRVRPDDQLRYIEQLKEVNVRFIASRNFARASELLEKRRTNKPTMPGVVTGASIEDLSH